MTFSNGHIVIHCTVSKTIYFFDVEMNLKSFKDQHKELNKFEQLLNL